MASNAPSTSTGRYRVAPAPIRVQVYIAAMGTGSTSINTFSRSSGANDSDHRIDREGQLIIEIDLAIFHWQDLSCFLRDCASGYTFYGAVQSPLSALSIWDVFYVVDGKKRDSVLKAHGEGRVQVHVTRWVPECSRDLQVKRYHEFMKYFPKTGLYQVFLSDAGDFAYLQKEMSLAPEQERTDMDRYHFMFTFTGVERVYLEFLGEYASVTAADAFVALLKHYSFSQVRAVQPWDLEKAIAEVLHLVLTRTAA